MVFYYNSAAECLPVCILSCMFLWHSAYISPVLCAVPFSRENVTLLTGGLSERQFSCWVSHIYEVGHCRDAHPYKQKPISICVWKLMSSAKPHCLRIIPWHLLALWMKKFSSLARGQHSHVVSTLCLWRFLTR